MTNCDTLITVEVSLQITGSLYIYLQSGGQNEHLKLCAEHSQGLASVPAQPSWSSQIGPDD